MRAILDVNVVLDVLLKRESFHRASARVLTLADRGVLEGYYCAASVDNTFYILRKALKKGGANEALVDLLDILKICPVDETVIRRALDDGWADTEDAIIYESARAAGLDTVITRNADHFKRGQLKVLTPDEVIGQLGNH